MAALEKNSIASKNEKGSKSKDDSTQLATKKAEQEMVLGESPSTTVSGASMRVVVCVPENRIALWCVVVQGSGRI